MCNLKFSFFTSTLLLISTSCGLLDKQYYHKLASHYNLLYNGRKSLELGIEKMKQNQVPNFYEISILHKSYSNEQNRYFSFAENRASTVLELHTMNDVPLWEQKHIIEAHIMLLKSCYLQNKKAPNLALLEQFEFQKLEPPLDFELFYWTIKAFINDGQNQKAIEMTKQFKNFDFINNQEDVKLQKLIAQAYLNEKDYHQVSVELKNILGNEEKHPFRIQYNYAQVLVQLNQTNAAINYFEHLANQTSNHLYALQGKLALIESNQNVSKESSLFLYNELLKNKRFKKFNHYVYNRLGTYHFNHQQFQEAKDFFQLSNHSQYIDRFTYQNNLQSIYRLELESENFINALTSLNEIINNEEPKNSLLEQQKHLVTIVELDKETQMIADSIHLATMDEIELKSHFDQNLETLLSQSLNQQFTEGQKVASNPIVENKPLGFLDPSDAFNEQWGERPNVDNWRYSASLIGSYQHRIDFSSDSINSQEKEILWKEYRTKFNQLKSDQVPINQRMANKTIDLVHLYLLFGLKEQSLVLLEKRKPYFLNAALEDSFTEIKNKIHNLK